MQIKILLFMHTMQLFYRNVTSCSQYKICTDYENENYFLDLFIVYSVIKTIQYFTMKHIQFNYKNSRPAYDIVLNFYQSWTK